MDVVVSMYNLIEYSDNYSKISGILWQHYNDESALNNDDNNVDFPGNSFSFKFKQKIMGNTSDDADTKVVEIAVPFKNLSNFWKIFETPLINFEINLILAWSANCVITISTGAGTFTITDTRPYVPVATLSTRDNVETITTTEIKFWKDNWLE